MTREIVINGRFLSRRITGVERYGREILSLFRGNYRVEMTRVNGARGHAWEQFTLPAKLKSESILWSPANTGPLMVRNQALTIHDLSPLEHPEWFRRDFAAWYRLFLPTLAKRVRVIFTPSEYVREKVIRRFGVKNVTVVPNGVNTARFHPGARPLNHDLPEKFIFFVGSIQPRKNLQALLGAWKDIKKEYPDLWLMIAGAVGTIFGGTQRMQCERVIFLDYVDDDDLPGIHAGATQFVLPSFDEGFGLPALEAMACGTPVIVSDGGALPEAVGDAGLIFDLADPGSLATALRRGLEDGDLRSFLRAKGLERAKEFPWQRSADMIWKTLNEI